MMRLVLAAVLSLIPAQAADKLALPDIFQLQTAGQPRISPDGRHIVYQRNFADVMTDRRYSNIWIIGFDGSGNRPLTTGLFSDTNARWSPDGTQVAYIS